MLRFKARRKDPTESPFLTQSQKRIMALLAEANRRVRNRVIQNEGLLLDAILHGPSTRFDTLVPSDPYYDIQADFQSELFAELVAAGKRYGALLPTMQKATIKFSFDEIRPEAANWAYKEAGSMIVEIVEDQRGVVRDYVQAASLGRYAPRDVARGLRDVIGLTSAQAGWVDNFRARQVASLSAAGLSSAQIAERADKATARYQARIHRYRSENIARTEILRASHEGRRQAWAQGLAQGYIGPSAIQEWSANLDGRVCPTCSSYDGFRVPISAEFPEGDPPLHPSCRCDVLLIDSPVITPELADMTDEELDEEIQSLLGIEQGEIVAIPALGQPAFDPAFAAGARYFEGRYKGPEWGNTKYERWQDHWEDTAGGDAIAEYSSEMGQFNFNVVNGHLRQGLYNADSLDELDANITAMTRALDDAVVPEDVIGVRGLTTYTLPEELQAVFDDIQPGALIHDPAFMSVSLSHVPALGTDIYLRVRVPAGSRGGYLGRLSNFGDEEQELLLQAGTTLRVVKAEKITAGSGRQRLFVDAEVVSQRPGAVVPPDDLMKSLDRYYRLMNTDTDVQKRKKPPLTPRFDEDGMMIEMGQKLNGPLEGVVIVPPPSR